jgi:hypothetical protein
MYEHNNPIVNSESPEFDLALSELLSSNQSDRPEEPEVQEVSVIHLDTIHAGGLRRTLNLVEDEAGTKKARVTVYDTQTEESYDIAVPADTNPYDIMNTPNRYRNHSTTQEAA